MEKVIITAAITGSIHTPGGPHRKKLKVVSTLKLELSSLNKAHNR
jgi:hypothetical protein